MEVRIPLKFIGITNIFLALRPESGWLNGYNLTWFDVPGECNRIWNGGSAGVACTDTDQMAGCILGGGTAVNAGLWWKVRRISTFDVFSLTPVA